jgi:hypothetical protein
MNYGWSKTHPIQKKGGTSRNMLTLQEKQIIRALAQALQEEQRVNLAFHERLRDENGRFLPKDQLEELPSELDEEYEERNFKLVKIKGSYGSYEVKEDYLKASEIILFTIVVGCFLYFLL